MTYTVKTAFSNSLIALLVKQFIRDMENVYELPGAMETYLIEQYTRILAQHGWEITYEKEWNITKETKAFQCEVSNDEEDYVACGETKLVALVRAGGEALAGGYKPRSYEPKDNVRFLKDRLI